MRPAVSVPAAGAKLEAVVHGESQPSTILLHGGPGLADYLLTLARLLEGEGITSVRYTQRGVGGSRGSGPYGVAAHVRDAEAIRSHFAMERPTLIGHSWGAALALFYAMHFPERVKALVLVTPMGLEPGWEKEGRAKLLSRIDLEAAARIHAIDEELRGNLNEADQSRLVLERFRLSWPGFFHGPAPRFMVAEQSGPAHLQTLADVRREIAKPDFRSRLGAIEAPALVIGAADDTIPIRCAEHIAGWLKNAELQVIEASGHFPWLEQPAGFMRHVKPFLASL